MKLRYTDQKYQDDATRAVTDIFKGQPNIQKQSSVKVPKLDLELELSLDKYIRNNPIELSNTALLDNIHTVQERNQITRSPELVHDIGQLSHNPDRDCRVELDVEMETGTGKTFVYTQTMFELNRLYGWTKFIIVVPSIAIREGIKQSLESTSDYFFSKYRKRIHYSIYDSSNMQPIMEFSEKADISAMIINMQAFSSKRYRIIYSERDILEGYKPIDLISLTHPIIIEDEPQKMGGNATRKGIAQFHPLFILNYSATHRRHHNCVYQLDALDAYNLRLVKRIEVKGIEVKNGTGTDGYLCLDSIITNKNQAPRAKIEMRMMTARGNITTASRIFSDGDSLYDASGKTKLEAYRGYTIAPGGINPPQDNMPGSVTFLNGITIYSGKPVGDSSEMNIRRAQIRETIKSHLEKEQSLFHRNIKCLSLFFIDEVSRYRQYDEEGNQRLGVYGRMFEEEYQKAVKAVLNNRDTDPAYANYLRSISVNDTHKGYFSIDKKGHEVNPKIRRARGNEEGESDDESAYELILKDKERLLSLEEPTRFIFSHSALREGWDNPNIFQICTLKNGRSETNLHQEIGRGLRLCVNYLGSRQDAKNLGEDIVQRVNLLTVISSGSYTDYVKNLQKEIIPDLHDRPTTVDVNFFSDHPLINDDGNRITFSTVESKILYNLLIAKNVLNPITGLPTKLFDNTGLSQVEKDFNDYEREHRLDPTGKLDAASKLLSGVSDPDAVKKMVLDGNKKNAVDNFNAKNFDSEDFQRLWKQIDNQHVYTAHLDQKSFEKRAICSIDQNLHIGRRSYQIAVGRQNSDVTDEDLKTGHSFTEKQVVDTQSLNGDTSSVRYDLLGEISQASFITRRSAAQILQGISAQTFGLYRYNPEEFIKRVSDLIRQAKVDQITHSIVYQTTGKKYGKEIFLEEPVRKIDDGVRSDKAVQHYVFPDSEIEKTFAEELNKHESVVVYAKLPRSFRIPTPVGDYAPDWAIVFRKGTVKHIYLVAETKGTMDRMDLRHVEEAKIDCVTRLFKQMSRERHNSVIYHQVSDWDSLVDIANSAD